MNRIMLATLCLLGCQDSLEEDGIDDSFVTEDGKVDTGGILENSGPGFAVLRVANESDLAALEAAGVTTLTAQRIVDHRAGADGQLGTADDDNFDTLAELDAVPYTGPVLFGKLLERAKQLGYIVFDWRTHVTWAGWDASKPTVCRIDGPADAKDLKLLFDITQSASWRVDIRNTSGTLVQTIVPPFSGWSQPIAGNRLTYSVYGSGYANCKDFRHLVKAIAAQEPVAVGDPFRCTTSAPLVSPTPMGAMAGELGMFSLPNVNLFHPFGDAFTANCGEATVAIKYTPPTDGLYTFRSFDHRRISVREGGCDGAELGCANRETTVKLHAGVPVAIGVASTEHQYTWVTVLRARSEVACDDGFDDNGDGAIDCVDPTCAEACEVQEICTNNVDDNMDGKLDCLDSDCSSSAACSANTCPGVDLGAATSLSGPVAGGNALASPASQWLACGAAALPWQGSRFFIWRAPAAGTYRFTVTGNNLYDYAIKLLDGTCDGDALACGRKTNGSANAVMTLAADQPLVIEVGLSRYSTTSAWAPFTLSIRPQ